MSSSEDEEEKYWPAKGFCDPDECPGVIRQEAERLRRENKKLRKEVEILKSSQAKPKYRKSNSNRDLIALLVIGSAFYVLYRLAKPK